MKCLITLLMALLITACGQAPESAIIDGYHLPDSACEVRDACTHSDVPGYKCVADRVSTRSYCLIRKQDYQTDPSCDPANPNKICGAVWGVPGEGKPCCQTVQGPGEAL